MLPTYRSAVVLSGYRVWLAQFAVSSAHQPPGAASSYIPAVPNWRTCMYSCAIVSCSCFVFGYPLGKRTMYAAAPGELEFAVLLLRGTVIAPALSGDEPSQ